MDFGLSEEQVLLDGSIRGFLADTVPISRVRELRDAASPNDREIWQQLAELGVAGILVSEECGGSDLSLLDAVVVAQALGYAVTPTPFLSSGVMVPVALRALEGSQAGDWLGRLAGGELVFGVAVTELFSVREQAGVSLSDGKLSGKAMMAIDACEADYILVAADSRTLAVVRREADGLELTRLLTTDTTRCTSELRFDRVVPEAVFDDAREAIEQMLLAGRIVLAAETLGACESMIDQALAYSKDRKQFDRVIGSFQAVKHMCAEMIAELEPARSLVWYAAHSFNSIPDEAPLMACHVLSHLSEIGREISSIATQVHGGIGWTDEQNLHFWFKRIGVARHLLGGPDFLRERAAEIQQLTPA